MPRIPPVARADVPELEDVFSRAEAALGFVPNSFFVMARTPEILRAFTRLAREVIGVPGKVPLPLKRMAAYMASRTAGCQYCSAHTGETAVAVDGVPAEKLAAVWEYETSNLFDDAERAVLRVAQGAGSAPNAVTDADMKALQAHFDDDQIVEIVAAICLFGWLNRWNDTMATDLETRPLEFGLSTLAESGWEPGKHVKE